jgi:hypothetical protein
MEVRHGPRAPKVSAAHVSAPTSEERKAQAALMGAVAGLFGGAGIGYALTKGPDCDMCGPQGIVLGAPIGAVVGAIVAVRR